MFLVRISDNHRIRLTVPCSVEITDGRIAVAVHDSNGKYIGQSDFYFPPGTKIESLEKSA